MEIIHHQKNCFCFLWLVLILFNVLFLYLQRLEDQILCLIFQYSFHTGIHGVDEVVNSVDKLIGIIYN